MGTLSGRWGSGRFGFSGGFGSRSGVAATLLIGHGDPMIFFNRPISLGLLIVATLLLLVVALPAIRGKRQEVFQEG